MGETIEDLARKTDFKNAQFAKEEVADKVVAQYDDGPTRVFYQITMGGGGHDIHYGIFKKPGDKLKEGSGNTTEFLATCMEWATPRPVDSSSRVLDLGSGHGGSTHYLVQKYGCRVQCFNICPQQNEMNRARCVELGISDKVDIVTGDFNKPLPREWEGAFDVVWSSEVLCHAGDKQEIVAQIARVLKPGGVLCFTDIMGADDADEAQLRTFTDRNATTKLGRPSAYVRHFASAGLRYVSWWDNSHHLVRQFRTQLQSIDEFEGELKAAGLSDSFLNNWRESLTERVKVQSQHRVFAWGVFVARKPTAEELAAVAAGAAEANGH